MGKDNFDQKDKEDLVSLTGFALAEAMGEAFDLTEFKVATAIFKALYESNKEVRYFDPRTPPSEFFTKDHGIEDTGSPHCLKYMEHRTHTKMGGAFLAGAGKLAQPATMEFDVGGILQHGNATASTSAHLYNLRAIAKRYRSSKTIQDWIKLLIKCKMMKLGVRGTQLVTASIPVGPVGIASDVAAGLAKAGIKLTMYGIVNQLAMQLHWRAYLETRLTGHIGGRADKPNGPASAIYFELFRRRGATRIFGQYNVPAMILEPAGHLPLRDKLLMI